jgi:hypothetical protein
MRVSSLFHAQKPWSEASAVAGGRSMSTAAAGGALGIPTVITDESDRAKALQTQYWRAFPDLLTFRKVSQFSAQIPAFIYKYLFCSRQKRLLFSSYKYSFCSRQKRLLFAPTNGRYSIYFLGVKSAQVFTIHK